MNTFWSKCEEERRKAIESATLSEDIEEREVSKLAALREHLNRRETCDSAALNKGHKTQPECDLLENVEKSGPHKLEALSGTCIDFPCTKCLLDF
jgi:hypothetical protein